MLHVRLTKNILSVVGVLCLFLCVSLVTLHLSFASLTLPTKWLRKCHVFSNSNNFHSGIPHSKCPFEIRIPIFSEEKMSQFSHFWMSLSFPSLSHPMNPIGMPISRLRWHQILLARRPAGHFAEKMDFFYSASNHGSYYVPGTPRPTIYKWMEMVKQPLSM